MIEPSAAQTPLPSAAPRLVPETGEPCDVLVIGGGPAGSTAAALLAERGLSVVLLEKDQHPRFHIGESLLPLNLPILERLGLRDAVHAIGVYKPGAEFVSDATGERVSFPFALAPNPKYKHSYQVRRSEFDALLFDNARRRGASAREGARVTDVTFVEGGRAQVTAVEADGARSRFAPRFVLDASGRDTFLGARVGTKSADKHNNTAAVFAHFRGVAARTDETEGYISVHLAEDGWFWMIPLPDDVMSVGFVGTQAAFKKRRGSKEEFFHHRLRTSPTVSARMANAEIASEVTATGNYSYKMDRAWGEGYYLIGDAFGFVDPVFSSGVLLAMTSGELGAEVAATWLKDARAGRSLAQRSEKKLRRAMDNLSWLIYRINEPVLRGMFMNPSNRFRMRDGIISMLAGNLERRWRSVLPELAFKTAYMLLSGAHRFGLLRAAEPRPVGQRAPA